MQPEISLCCKYLVYNKLMLRCHTNKEQLYCQSLKMCLNYALVSNVKKRTIILTEHIHHAELTVVPTQLLHAKLIKRKISVFKRLEISIEHFIIHISIGNRREKCCYSAFTSMFRKKCRRNVKKLKNIQAVRNFLCTC